MDLTDLCKIPSDLVNWLQGPFWLKALVAGTNGAPGSALDPKPYINECRVRVNSFRHSFYLSVKCFPTLVTVFSKVFRRVNDRAESRVWLKRERRIETGGDWRRLEGELSELLHDP